MSDDGRETHFPSRNGPVCGRDVRAIGPTQPRILTPTDARDYDPVNPTCLTCANWLKAVRARAPRETPAQEQPTPSKASLRRNE